MRRERQDLPWDAVLDRIEQQASKPDDLTRILSAAAWSPATRWQRFVYRLRRRFHV